jgi:phosphatidylglycerophosphate synthase
VYSGHSDTVAAPSALAEEVLWVEGDAVFDPRLYRAAWEAETGMQVTDGEPIGLAKLTAGAARARLAAPADGWADGLRDLEVASVDTYVPEMRRRLRPYWVRLATPADRRQAERLVLDAAQKGNLDFPARVLHPWPENALATALVHAPLTPNHVTVISAVVGFAATFVLFEGRYLAGFVLALVANVLDGVDGKLARITLRQSEGGDRLDHALDIGFEFSWYLALGWSLSRAAPGLAPLWVGIGILVTMVACRVTSGTYQLLSGRSIHDHLAFDRAFRVVAGRRNNYVLLLLVGHLAGDLAGTFRLVLWYAIGTLGVYATRNLMALLAGRAHARRGV